VCVGSGSIPGISQTINHNHMEVITFSPDMDLSSKEAGDVFRLKLYGIETYFYVNVSFFIFIERSAGP
jgi:hypothetical protein